MSSPVIVCCSPQQVEKVDLATRLKRHQGHSSQRIQVPFQIKHHVRLVLVSQPVFDLGYCQILNLDSADQQVRRGICDLRGIYGWLFTFGSETLRRGGGADCALPGTDAPPRRETMGWAFPVPGTTVKR